MRDRVVRFRVHPGRKPRVPTVSDFASTWLPSLPQRINVRTARLYERVFRLYVLPGVGTRRLDELRRPDVIAFGLEVARVKSPATLRQIMVALSSMFSAAVDLELVESNPVRAVWRKLPLSRRGKAARAVPRETLARFLAAADVLPTACHMRDVFLTMALAGLRVSETLGLRPEDLDAEGKRLHVERQCVNGVVDVPKGGHTRVVDIPDVLVALLQRRISAVPGRRWLFESRGGRPYHSHSVKHAIAAVCRALGIPRFTPHAIRHSYACYVMEQSGDLLFVSRQLGHQDIKVTASVYLAAAQPRRPETLRVLADSLGAPLDAASHFRTSGRTQ